MKMAMKPFPNRVMTRSTTRGHSPLPPPSSGSSSPSNTNIDSRRKNSTAPKSAKHDNMKNSSNSSRINNDSPEVSKMMSPQNNSKVGINIGSNNTSSSSLHSSSTNNINVKNMNSNLPSNSSSSCVSVSKATGASPPHITLRLHSGTASPIVVPPRSESLQTMTPCGGRPESRCSQHSSTSVASSNANGAGSAPTRTTTSRRGGRASSRSRSPVNTMNYGSRSSSANPTSNNASNVSSSGNGGNIIMVDSVNVIGSIDTSSIRNDNNTNSNNDRNIGMSNIDRGSHNTEHPHFLNRKVGNNKGPSSAAAAAAAAAKALCEPNPGWFGDNNALDGAHLEDSDGDGNRHHAPLSYEPPQYGHDSNSGYGAHSPMSNNINSSKEWRSLPMVNNDSQNQDKCNENMMGQNAMDVSGSQKRYMQDQQPLHQERSHSGAMFGTERNVTSDKRYGTSRDTLRVKDQSLVDGGHAYMNNNSPQGHANDAHGFDDFRGDFSRDRLRDSHQHRHNGLTRDHHNNSNHHQSHHSSHHQHHSLRSNNVGGVYNGEPQPLSFDRRPGELNRNEYHQREHTPSIAGLDDRQFRDFDRADHHGSHDDYYHRGSRNSNTTGYGAPRTRPCSVTSENRGSPASISTAYRDNTSGSTSRVRRGRSPAGDSHMMPPVNSSPSSLSIKRPGMGSGGTSRVMGTPTPIHVPRAGPDPSSRYDSDQQQQRGGESVLISSRSPLGMNDASSVFRGRPTGGPGAREDIGDDDSPQKILLSLRTHTRSFEENEGVANSSGVDDQSIKGAEGSSKGGTLDRDSTKHSLGQHQNEVETPAPLSPEAPPQIQHSHHQHQMSPNTLFFEPQRSPGPATNPINSQSGNNSSNNNGSGPGIEVAPSFNLFNQSFDSLGDTAHYLSANTAAATSTPLRTFRSQSFSHVPSVDENSPRKPSLSLSRTGSIGPLGGGGLSFSPHGQYNSGTKNSLYSGPSPGGIMLDGSGMTPTNSFGGPIFTPGRGAGHRDGGNIMILGGDDATSHGPPALPPETSFSSGNTRSINSQLVSPRHVNASLRMRNSANDSESGTAVSSHYMKGSGAIQNPTERGPVYSNHNGSASVRHSPPSSAVGRNTESRTNGALRPDIGAPTSLNGMNTPHFYHILLRHKEAFDQCTFLLPGLKAAMCSKSSSKDRDNDVRPSDSSSPDRVKVDLAKIKDNTTPNRGGIDIPTPQVSYSPETQSSFVQSETTMPSNGDIARRRVKSAICAFGGNSTGTNAKETDEEPQNTTIFRIKTENGSSPKRKEGTSICNTRSKKKIKYEEELPNRFYENENRLSWEIEESPPVDISNNESEYFLKHDKDGDSIVDSPSSQRLSGPLSSDEGLKTPKVKKNKSVSCKKDDGEQNNSISKAEQNEEESMEENTDSNTDSVKAKDEASTPGSNDQPKMRYRCKLCGQPKQNHTCPYQQSLQRSIGVMIYPAVNAFTACEPGYLAPALSEMNNFVSGSESNSTETTPSRPTPDRPTVQSLSGSMVINHHGPANVTPETMRGAMHPHNMHHPMNSPSSSLSTISSTPQRASYRRTPGSMPRNVGSHAMYMSGNRMGYPTPGSMRRKRTLSLDESPDGSISSASDLLFVDGTELRPEQYRIVSVSTPKGSYEYPSLPLPYLQRKRLSDNLFSLSKEVSQLTDECALVLREAREKDMWDVAVAELMTQVIVVMRCPKGDRRLDGLSNYLLTLGFAC